MGRKINIQELKDYALKKGGMCLSDVYVNNIFKYKWQCNLGHIWESNSSNVMDHGKWCPYCAGNIRLDIQKLKDFAESRGGKCVSESYTNNRYKYEWQCNLGHTWKANVDNVLNKNSWCPYCSNCAKLDIQKLKDFALTRDGLCLSNNYINTKTKYEWRCKNKHIWFATATNILSGGWCPECNFESRTATIEKIKEFAAIRGGRFLSDVYKNTYTKYKWQCDKGHIWESTSGKILMGIRWCPYCFNRHSKSEVEVFNYVKSICPDALNGKGSLLENKRFELDVYIPSLKKAIEFDGTFWHKSEWAISNGSVERDLRKSLQCQEAGIKLLRVDEEEFIQDKNKVFDKILEFLKH